MSHVCVECRKEATEGSMRHPYCKACFKRVWNNNQDRYFAWLDKHDRVIMEEQQRMKINLAEGIAIAVIMLGLALLVWGILT
jgi:hypothetical protein